MARHEWRFMSGRFLGGKKRDGWHGHEAKKPSHSITLGYFLRNGWNYCHITAFLIDSQEKFP